MRKQLAASLSQPDPYRRRELSWVSFDVELSPTGPETGLPPHSEVYSIMRGESDMSTLMDLLAVDTTRPSGLSNVLLYLADRLPPVPQTLAGWQTPQGQPHHEQHPVWQSDVTTSLHRNTLAGVLEEPGVKGLLAQHRSQQPPVPLTNTNTNTHTGGNENAGTGIGAGIGTERAAAAAKALGLHPTALGSIEVALQGHAPLRPALDALHQLAARLEAGPTNAFVRRMTELNAPLFDWWHFSSHLRTRQLTMSHVVGMNLAEAKRLYSDSRTQPLPYIQPSTEVQANALGVHPRYLTRVADALHVRPEDVANLGRDKSFWQRPLSPEAMGHDYLVSERERREDVRLAREQDRFNALADELLGNEPTLAEKRFHSFMNWSGVSHLPLDIFTDQRLRELVGHWHRKTNGGTDQVPAGFNLRADGVGHADLLLAVELARMSGPLPPRLAEELTRREKHIKSQLEILDDDYEGACPRRTAHP